MTARDNPFATDRAERLLIFRPEWSGLTMAELKASWEKLNYFAVVTGKHGAGKSTLLDFWGKHLEKQGQSVIHLFLNRETRTLSPDQWLIIEECHEKPSSLMEKSSSAGSNAANSTGSAKTPRAC